MNKRGGPRRGPQLTKQRMTPMTTKSRSKPIKVTADLPSRPRSYRLTGIPPDFWAAVQDQARKEKTTVRTVILQDLALWLNAAEGRARGKQLVADLRAIVADSTLRAAVAAKAAAALRRRRSH